jgi:hypothetical protein
MTPEERRALVSGSQLPERLRQFERSQDSREAMLQRQAEMAHQLGNSPMPIQTNNTPAAVAAIIANTLRSFGGAALEHVREGDLAKAKADGQRQHEELMRLGESATGAGLDTKKRGLADALRMYGGSI